MLVVVPVALLVRRVPWWSLVAGVSVMAALVALGIPDAVQGSHPSLARLERTVSSIDVPADQRVVVRQSAPNPQRIGDTPLWTIVVQTAPEDAEAAELPSAVVAGAGGTLPQGDLSVAIVGLPLPATSTGRAAAAQWEASLRAQGWQQDPDWVAGTDSYRFPTYLYLPGPAELAVSAPGSTRFEHGTWESAWILPHRDGAILVVSTRP